ncbi:MAG: hypothetical protein KF891_14130 [Rhizobacter sp.]|nr:hypothetical protein [Rhizobacter sp.]
MNLLHAALRGLRRGLRAVLLAAAAAILFFEEWGWRPLTACVAWFARWPPLARLEARIRRVPPRGALVLFLVPVVLLFPVKLAALWLIHQGRAGLGLAVIVAAKLVGTALVGRLFVLTEAKLVQFVWFARALGWWRTTKLRVKAAVQGSAAWRMARALRRRLRVLLRRFAR